MKNPLIGKDPDAGKDLGREKKGATEDEMVGWHCWLRGHEFEQTPGDNKAVIYISRQETFWLKEEGLSGSNLMADMEEHGLKQLELIFPPKKSHRTDKNNSYH